MLFTAIAELGRSDANGPRPITEEKIIERCNKDQAECFSLILTLIYVPKFQSSVPLRVRNFPRIIIILLEDSSRNLYVLNLETLHFFLPLSVSIYFFEALGLAIRGFYD